MRIFAIADLHLSHDGSKPMDIYGSQWIRHRERTEAAWRRLIETEDLVLLVGDLSWALKLEEAIPDLQWIADLPGQKVLIKGNHDLWWSSLSKLRKLDERLFFLQNDYYKAGEYAICGCRGWICPGDANFTEHDQKIYQRELGRLRLSLEAARSVGETKLICGIHFPPFNDRMEDTGFTELFREFSVQTVVYGHLHGPDAHQKAVQGWRDGVEYRLVACDYLNCTPLLLSGRCVEERVQL
ncbi:MAG TPA: serine/threonine protein phosphatase [Clostridiales bacterium]|jgi:predicted phosphohydrolase|nr:serine/threonine protein phosphatase [Clostridiales bacterium]